MFAEYLTNNCLVHILNIRRKICVARIENPHNRNNATLSSHRSAMICVMSRVLMTIESNLSYEREIKRTNSIKTAPSAFFSPQFHPAYVLHAYIHIWYTHVRNVPTCARPVRVIVCILACAYANYFMHVRAPPPVPSCSLFPH